MHLHSDFGQAKLRFVIAAGFGFYVLMQSALSGHRDPALLAVAGVMGGYLVVSFLFYLGIKRFPRRFALRRFVAIISDNLVVTVVIGLAPQYIVPVVFVYLWITIVNGIRFGVYYLGISAVVASYCLSLLLYVDDFTADSAVLLRTVFAAFLLLTLVGFYLVNRKLGMHDNAEREQALIRSVIGTIFIAYFFSCWLSEPLTEMLFAVEVATAGVLASFLIFMHIATRPRASAVRRYLGLLVDIGATTAILSQVGEVAAPMLGVYLWVTMGNGFRYGVSSLYAAEVVSLLGFSLAVALNPFWREHALISLGFGIILLALPLYMVTLLKRLNMAIRRANEANHAKTQFLANMSHELRTPLNAVIGVSDLLLDAQINPYQTRLARRIQSSAQLLLGMIERILDISKIEAGRIELRNDPFDLYSLLNDVEAVFEMQAESKGLRLDLFIAPDVPVSVVGDPGRVRQILVNLLGNAFKFTEQGWVRLRVHIRQEDVGTTYIVFDVEDTGIGIPPDRQSKIFEPFVQADDSVTRRYGGTGLGMSISRQLAEAMGGRIALHSVEGRGSTFTVSLPLTPAGDRAALEHGAAPLKMDIAIFNVGWRDAECVSLLEHWGFDVFRFDTESELYSWCSTIRGPRAVLIIVDGSKWLSGMPGLCVNRARINSEIILQQAVMADRDEADKLYRRAETGFDWLLESPLSERTILNIVHYVSLKYGTDENVVSLAEHYAGRKGRRLRILVAEDNQINKLMINELLLKVGHEVILVDDGEQAIDALIDSRFDLAMLDLNMPKLSGLDVLKTCRFRRDLRDLPVMILSADATTGTQLACRDAGADMFVTKPLDSRYLLDLIAGLEERGETRAERGDGNNRDVPGPRQSEELIDQDIVRQFKSSGIETSFFADLLEQFVEQGREQLVAMRKAIDDNNVSKLKDQLHRLKGGASYFGALRLVEQCDAAEKAVPDALASERVNWVESVEELFYSSCKAFSEFIESCERE